MHTYNFKNLPQWITAFLMTIAVIIPAQATAFEVEKVEGSTLYFRAEQGSKARTLNTGLYDMKLLGYLRTKNTKDAYAVVAGRPCQDCLQEKAIYLFKPEGGKPDQVVYPGRIVDPKHNQVVLESRTFLGNCLPQNNEVLVTFQRERVDRRHGLQSSLLVIEAGADHLQEKLIEKRVPKINFTLKQVKQKLCREIEGRNRLILNKPLDLTPRHGNNDNDDENEEEEDEDKTSNDDPTTSSPAKTPAL